MKQLLILLSALIFSTANAATYYVAPAGNDATGTGAIGTPWLTLTKAWTVVVAGDIIYMRGGTYRYTSAGISLSNKSGLVNKMINIWNYAAEKPIIDYGNIVFTVQCKGLRLENTDYIYIKGIKIRNIKQPVTGDISQYGLIAWDDVNNCIFENIETDHIGGWGIVFGSNCSNNLLYNCDSHHNFDPYSTSPYGGSDGFETAAVTGTGNVMRGCRFWMNSDDGIDLRYAVGTWTVDNCWAWMNGYRENGTTTGGDGNGFKLGPPQADMHTVHLRTVTNSLAFCNRTGGFESNTVGGSPGRYVAWLFNNTAYRNALNATYNLGFQFAETTAPYSVHILRNNIAYGNVNPNNVQANYDNCTTSNNTWNGGVTVTNADFISVDTTGVSGPRGTTGSLPVLNFLKLATGSDLIGAGTPIIVPPNMGAY